MKLEEAIQKISHKDWAVRSKAFETIMDSGEKPLPHLIAVLREDDSYRQEIAIALIERLFREKQVTHPDTVPTVIDAIWRNQKDNPLVVSDGLVLLKVLNDSRAFDDLVGFLANEDTISGAIEALAKLKDDRAIKHLAQILNNPESDIRYRALWAIGYIGHSEGIQVLVENLNNTLADEHGVSMSQIAQQELIRIGTPEALAAVEEWKRNQNT